MEHKESLEHCPTQGAMENNTEQWKEIQNRITCLFQSEESIRSKLQRVANQAEKMKQSSNKQKWTTNLSYASTRAKENAGVDPEYAKEVISKLLGEMNKWRAYWMQEMQLRHCCQNEVFEYKHMVAGIDASSHKMSEELEYYREQATRYKQTLLSTTKWCIQAMNESSETMQRMARGFDQLNNCQATTDRMQLKVKSFVEKNKKKTCTDDKLQQAVLNTHKQMTEKLDAIQNDIQVLNSTVATQPKPESTLQNHYKELQRWFQGMKQGMEEQIKKMMEMDNKSCRNNIQMLADLKNIGLQLQNIGNTIATQTRNEESAQESITTRTMRRTMRRFQLIKYNNVEPLSPYCPSSNIHKLSKVTTTTTVSILPQTDDNMLYDNSDAEKVGQWDNSSTWKVFKIQSTRRIGATHTGLQVDHDSIQTSHTETANIPRSKNSSLQRSNSANKACNQKAKGSKRAVPHKMSDKKTSISSKDKATVGLVSNKAQKEMDLLPKERDAAAYSSSVRCLQQEEDTHPTFQATSNSHETKKDNNVKSAISVPGQLQDAPTHDWISSSSNYHLNVSTKEPQKKTTPRVNGNQRVARSMKCFGKKRKTNIVDEYELTAESCSQTLPLSFFQNLQI